MYQYVDQQILQVFYTITASVLIQDCLDTVSHDEEWTQRMNNSISMFAVRRLSQNLQASGG